MQHDSIRQLITAAVVLGAAPIDARGVDVEWQTASEDAAQKFIDDAVAEINAVVEGRAVEPEYRVAPVSPEVFALDVESVSPFAIPAGDAATFYGVDVLREGGQGVLEITFLLGKALRSTQFTIGSVLGEREINVVSGTRWTTVGTAITNIAGAIGVESATSTEFPNGRVLVRLEAPGIGNRSFVSVRVVDEGGNFIVVSDLTRAQSFDSLAGGDPFLARGANPLIDIDGVEVEGNGNEFSIQGRPFTGRFRLRAGDPLGDDANAATLGSIPRAFKIGVVPNTPVVRDNDPLLSAIVVRSGEGVDGLFVESVDPAVLPDGQDRRFLPLEILTHLEAAEFRLVFNASAVNTLLMNDVFRVRIGDGENVRDFQFSSGTTLTAMANTIGFVLGSTLLTRVEGGQYIEGRTIESGSESFVSVEIVDDAGVRGRVEINGQSQTFAQLVDSAEVLTDTGLDAEVELDGIRIIRNGVRVNVDGFPFTGFFDVGDPACPDGSGFPCTYPTAFEVFRRGAPTPRRRSE